MSQNGRAIIFINAWDDHVEACGSYALPPKSLRPFAKRLSTVVDRFSMERGYVVWVESPDWTPQGQQKYYMARNERCSQSSVEDASRKTQNDDPQSRNDEREMYYYKMSPSAMPDEMLREKLRDKKVKELYFCGLLSKNCVDQTFFDARMCGGDFEVYVVLGGLALWCGDSPEDTTSAKIVTKLEDLDLSEGKHGDSLASIKGKKLEKICASVCPAGSKKY